MPFHELVSRRRRTRVSIVVLTLGTLFTLVTCKLNDLLSPVGATAAGQPKLVFSGGNQVKLGSPISVGATVTGADGVQLGTNQYRLDIVSVDNVVLSRDTAGNVVTKGVGTGILKVRIITAALPNGGDTLVDTIKVDYAGIKIATPVDSIVGLGDVTHAIVVNGLDVNGAVKGTISSNLTFTSRDTSVDSVQAGGIIKGKKNGSPYVVASYAGLFPSSDSVKVVVHQLAASFRLASSTMAVGALNTPRAVTAFVPVDKNGKDDTYPGTVITYTTDSASVLSFNASNQLSALKNGVAHITSAKADGVTSTASQVVTVTVAQVPAKLSFVEQPTSVVAGQAGAVQVAIADSGGVSISTSSGSVSLAITSGTGTSGATLCNAATSASTATCGQSSIATYAVNGVATFTTGIDKAGTGYTLLASAGAATATSTAIAVTTGSASRLVFTKQPGTVTGGFPDSIKVAVADAGGNVITTATNSITIAIASGGPAGTPLNGTLTQAASSGVATFGPSIDSAGTYTLAASTAGLGSVTSQSFKVISGTKSKVLFSVQPVAAAPTATMSTIKAFIADPSGNLVTSNIDTIKIAIGTNPASGTLTGTTSVPVVNGVATFSTLSINNAGNGYTLTASATGLTSATSSAFNITSTGATKLAFSGQPTSATGGSTLGTITVAIQTAASAATTNTDNVTLSITSGTGTSGAHLIGTATVAAVSGTATFTGLSIDSASASSYTLTATAPGLTGTTSSTFNVSVGAAAKLAFATQPSPTTGGATFSPVVKVSVLDAGGNVVTSSAASISMAVSGGAGTATLGGTTTLAAVNGVALFTDLNVNKTGTAYQLTATSAGVTTAVSNTFNVNLGPAAKLVGVAQPSSMTSGFTSAALTVGFTDLGGNAVSTATSNVTVAIVSGTGTAGATLSGTLTKAAASGQVSFTDLMIDKAGTGYQLIASSPGYPGITTTAFPVIAGSPTKLGFVNQPGNALQNAVINGSTGGVQVAIQDAAGNTVTSSAASITVALGANPGAGTLTGTLTAAASSGVATFSTLAINASGNGYTLNASSVNLASLTSSAFNVEGVAGAATKLIFSKQPAASAGGQTQTVQVSVADANGVVVTSATNSVALTITSGTGTSGATLCNGTSCGATTMSVSAASGVASFTVGVDKANTNYTLTATSTGLTSATSSAFSVVVGAPSQIAFQVSPKNTYLNAPLNPDTAVRVGVLDAGGNLVTSSTDAMSVTLTSGSGSLSGSTNFVASGGIAQMPTNVTISQTNASVTVKITDVTRAFTVSSNAFSVTSFGPAAQLVWTTPPWSQGRHPYYLTAISQFDTTAVATIEDRFGNVVTSSTDSVAVTISSPAGISTVNARTQAASGVAAFANMAVNKGGSSVVALASDITNTSVTPATSPLAVSASSYGFPVANSRFITAFALSTSNSPSLFYTDSSGGSIWSVPANGPSLAPATLTQTLGGSVITRMVQYNGALYFIDGASTSGAATGRIRSIATSANFGTATTVLSGRTNMNAYYFQVDASGALYWIQQGTQTREIHRLAGTTETVVAGVNSTVTPVFYVSGTTLYYYDATVSGGAIKSVPVAGGTTATLGTGITVSTSPGALTVVGSTLYFSDSLAAVKSIPTAGGAVTTKFSGIADARELVSDGTSLFLYHNGGAPNRYDLATFTNTQFNDYGGSNIGMLVDASSTVGGPSVYWMTAPGTSTYYIAKMSTTATTPFTLSVQAPTVKRPSFSRVAAPAPTSKP